MMEEEVLECLDDYKGQCQGSIEYRCALSGSGKSFPRCDHHWDLRLDAEERNREKYPDSDLAPDWFDPTYAGERWNDDE